MSQFFQFEADFVTSLRCIPMIVRYKLDTCGVKLKLHQWNQFNQADRQMLVDMACTTSEEIQAYRDRLHELIQIRTGETATDLAIDPHPPWHNGDRIPDSVLHKADSEQISISLSQWQSLSPLERFALIKLSRSNHENSNFRPAIQELRLI